MNLDTDRNGSTILQLLQNQLGVLSEQFCEKYCATESSFDKFLPFPTQANGCFRPRSFSNRETHLQFNVE